MCKRWDQALADKRSMSSIQISVKVKSIIFQQLTLSKSLSSLTRERKIKIYLHVVWFTKRTTTNEIKIVKCNWIRSIMEVWLDQWFSGLYRRLRIPELDLRHIHNAIITICVQCREYKVSHKSRKRLKNEPCVTPEYVFSKTQAVKKLVKFNDQKRKKNYIFIHANSLSIEKGHNQRINPWFKPRTDRIK